MIFPQPASAKILLLLIAVVAWFALVAQFYLNITSGVAALPELLIRYFSYFTILTNILVAACCTSLLLRSNSSKGSFFTSQQTRAAIVVYIVIVGIVYNTVLRSLWQPKGLQLVVDEILHLITPVLFLLYWLFFVPKNSLKWKHSINWMIYPLFYGAFVLTRGYLSASQFYPYPFIDISKIGVNGGIMNTLLFTAIFLIASLLLIGVGKLMSRKING